MLLTLAALLPDILDSLNPKLLARTTKMSKYMQPYNHRQELQWAKVDEHLIIRLNTPWLDPPGA